MKLNIIKGTVYEFENFLSLDEKNTLLSIINNKLENNNTIYTENVSNEYWKDKYIQVENEVMSALLTKVKLLFNSYDHINPLSGINIFSVGHKMNEHSDEIGDPNIKYGVVIYINDDFNGGEICYPKLNLTHKPKSGSLIIHPGDIIHSVNTVLEGPPRYAITTFVHGTEKSPAVLKYENS